MAKRKLKQTKAALLSRLYYQKKKLKQISKEYEKFSDRDGKKKVHYNGKKRTHKTIANYLLDEGKKINNLISSFENKIRNHQSREKIKKEKLSSIRGQKARGDKLNIVGNVWHRKDFDENINMSKIKSVNGFSKRKDADKIHSLVDEMFLRMNSKDLVCILTKPDGSSKVFLIKDGEGVDL